MEYSRKMVLVPQEVYDAMMNNKFQPGSEHINNPEDKLHTLLEDKKIPTDYKMKLYNHELQKVIDNKQKFKEKDEEEEEVYSTHQGNMIEKELLESLPRSLKIKGKLLLERLKANNITWNAAGELIIDSVKYHGTNIIDLVNDVMRNRKYSAPFGWQTFADQLIRLNVPQEMIVNKSRWNYILKHKTNTLNVENEETEEDIELNNWESL